MKALVVSVLLVGVIVRNVDTQNAGRGAKPIRELKSYVDGPTAPTDLTAMLNRVAAVVVGHYTGKSRFIQETDPARAPIVMTGYFFQILEIIKADPLLPPVGGTLEVKLIGGDIELPTLIERKRVDGTSLPQPNGTYAIFLIRDHAGQELWPAFTGYGGLYEVGSGQVVPLGRSGSAHAKKDAQSFLTDLRIRARPARR
jgi:hypothetical protein